MLDLSVIWRTLLVVVCPITQEQKRMKHLKRFDVYGRADYHDNGNLYDADEVHRAILAAIDDETKDDIIGNICEAFGLKIPNND